MSLLPAADTRALMRRVSALTENRPGIYRMIDPAGRVLYVGKAKRLRTRVLSYFRARDDKASIILQAAHDITWDYQPSEFAAHLAELREIKKHRPMYNVQMNRRRRAVFIALTAGPIPKLALTGVTARAGVRYFGPFSSAVRAGTAIRVINDLLGLRDCADRLPMVLGDQGDLFAEPKRAACPRYEFGTCSGPCGGFVTEAGYRERTEAAVRFLGGYQVQPIDRVIAMMMRAAETQDFEAAARWREKFEALEWLLAASARARLGIDLLSFVYREPGALGDERVYLIRSGLVRATYPYPNTPLELEVFKAVVAGELASPLPPGGPLQAATMDEMLLVMSWFRRHPDALRRTSPFTDWAA
ncbi:MAG: nuclease [Gemmatimonadota bacterium]